MKHIRTIINKEWSEVFKNKMVLSVVLVMPILFSLLPLVMLGVTSSTSMLDISPEEAGLPPELFTNLCGGMNAGECTQVYMLSQFMLFFVMMPLIIPTTIAAYSIVGEKTTRSLEPLLATPTTTTELLAGKCFAAVIPAVAATFVSFLIFNIGILILGISPKVHAYVLSPTWLVGILLLGPVLSIISAMFAIFVSSRVNDPRVAEQIASVMIVPFMGVFLLSSFGVITLNLTSMVIAAIICAIVAGVLLYLGTLIFDRENILTKWK
ncbi:MAG TPA: ABC transporter permease subunit [Anaerolineaceae bacterium]|nr:ABC transporter permease subunit [Anaerolineaceae bacterium]